MSGLLNADASFSSKQELLDLQDYPPDGDPSVDRHSPVDSQTGSPIGSGPRRPQSLRADGSLQSGIFTGATSFHGQLYDPAATQCGHTPMNLNSDQMCGWGALRPRTLQVFNTPQWVLVFLCVAAFLQGMIINGFINTVVTSIERRFDLSSSQTGLIVSSYDIAACVCLIFVSYYGGNGHKPQWLGWGVLIMGLGSLVFAVPHFTTPPYQVTVQDNTDTCSANHTSLCENKDGGGLSSYRFVFMLGQFLHGIGATPLYTLGVTYLDENVNPSSAPLYIGIFYTAGILGPAAGYLLGGFFLKIFTEMNMRTEMTPENPLWVGAWWIGFLAGGAACLLVAFPIAGYPRELPGSQESAAMRVSETHQLKDGSHSTASDPEFGKSLKDMPRSVLLLLRNPPFLLLCLAGAMDANLIAAISTFGPKFLESQFSLSASWAATVFGCMVVPAGGGGTFLGGYIVKRLNLRCRGIIRFCIVCALSGLVTIIIFLVHCPDTPMAGITAEYQTRQMDKKHLYESWALDDQPSKLPLINSSSLDEKLTADCNANCSCAKELFNPVCGADGIMYYSPCYAGCSSFNYTHKASKNKMYTGCSCVVSNESWGHEGLAFAGRCASSCSYMPLFMGIFFFSITFTFLSSIPALTATLRCVPENQKSFALGIQWILVRTLGAIPGPIVFGSLVDKSCLLWQEKCWEQGSCYLYKNSDMSKHTLVAGLIFKVLGVTFFILANTLYKAPPESPQSSCESTEHGTGDISDLTIKALPEDGVIVNEHARDS